MRRLRAVCGQLVRTGLTVWVLTSVVFLLSYRDTETALVLALPETIDYRGPESRVALQAGQQAVRERLGMNLPLFYLRRGQWQGTHNQYHQWLRRLSHGELGTSFRTGQPVSSELGTALALTLPLTGTAALLLVLTALWLAQRLAARPWWYHPVHRLLVALHTLPLFVLALTLLLLFANPDVLPWFPAYGFESAGEATGSPLAQGLAYARHLTLPVAALVLSALPEWTLQLEAALARELATDYATTARAKGLAPAALIRRHALRNAALPTITQLGQLLPGLVGGAVVVEVVFALPGMGRLLATAATGRDYPVLISGVLLTGLAQLVGQLLADLLSLWADPRIRWQS